MLLEFKIWIENRSGLGNGWWVDESGNPIDIGDNTHYEFAAANTSAFGIPHNRRAFLRRYMTSNWIRMANRGDDLYIDVPQINDKWLAAARKAAGTLRLRPIKIIISNHDNTNHVSMNNSQFRTISSINDLFLPPAA